MVPRSPPSALLPAFLWLVAGVAAFHIAYFFPRFNALILLYVIALANLARVRTGRQAVYFGFFTGFLVAAPQLSCFWVIFWPVAISLWCVIGFWIGLFVFLARLSLVHFGWRGALLFPVLWMWNIFAANSITSNFPG